MNEQQPNIAKIKIQKVFAYIRELTKLRTPPTSLLSSYEWVQRYSDLPSYPTISTARLPDENNADEFDGVVLRVKRPIETPCPRPNEILDGWIEAGWEKLTVEARHLPAKNKIIDGQTITEKFEDDEKRVKEFEDWVIKRMEWVEAERPVRAASEIFADLFKLQAQIQRESEKYQLYLSDGHLLWESAHGEVNHPIILKKVELEFDSTTPEFLIRETEDPIEIYSALLRYHDLDGTGILACKNRLEESEPHPLSDGRCKEFLKFTIQRFFPNGKYFENKKEIQSGDPLIYRDPVLFLGNRSQGFAEALDKLVESIPIMDLLPEALIRIVGIDETVPNVNEMVEGQAADELSILEKKSVDFLLTKPANAEQERVITRLEQFGSVLVQGPPGTGKSHTIANIIGHLLASGKTVLVSSHTSKALKVVREKVVDALQPLCVSVLGNDTESKSQLEESVNGIVSYLSRTDIHALSKEIGQLETRRNELKTRILQLEDEALDIRKGEYADIVISGEAISPAEAARRVSELSKEHGWLPGSILDGAPIPMSIEDLNWLYSSNCLITKEEEECFREGLIEIESFPKIDEFNEIVGRIKSISIDQANQFSDLWKSGSQNSDKLRSLIDQLKKSFEIINAHSWLEKVFEDSQLGDTHRESWVNLVNQIESTSSSIGKKSELVYKYGPIIEFSPNENHIQAATEIVLHLKSGKTLGFFSTAFKPDWKQIITATKVDAGVPTTHEHFEAILAHLEINQRRMELVKRWNRQVVENGGHEIDPKQPEKNAVSFVEAIKFALNWRKEIWTEIENLLSELDFEMEKAKQKINLSGQSKRYFDQIKNLIEKVLIPASNARMAWVSYITLENQKAVTLGIIRSSSKPSNLGQYLSNIGKAISENDTDGYSTAYFRFLEISGKAEIFQKRELLLSKLETSAKTWANSIRARIEIHGNSIPPKNIDLAWRVRQWEQSLEKRLEKNYAKVQKEIQRNRAELQGVNAQYVEKLAWRFQFSRTGLKEKQALTGWQQLQNKITKTGRGVRDSHLKREARKNLKDCKNAVPVWIMPLSRVFDSFDLVSTKFDVLILDEASQSDITSLVAFAIAKQVVVVGDSEQVTPYAVGQELNKIQALIDELLQGIPNRMLYDGKTSVYDLAEQSFGETIRLVEHFRCVPDIIQFSNHLSYNGEIRPLRESTSSPYAEHILLHRVEGKKEENKTNKAEALEIASIVSAMLELGEYSNASIGIISLLGYEQAIYIDTLLQRRLAPNLYAKHKLLCGNASQFQGDERDIILISMVDSCDDPPLSIRQTEDFKKTFNVAASRARDQMWIVHSLNPSTDLKPGDLRLRLIHHAQNPKAILHSIESAAKNADSPFEVLVIKDLIEAGYRLKTQWEVGAYRIDIVVEGIKRRIAIECDGDRSHPPEKLADDMQRQMVLERLGWTFIRLRGSEYFRYPKQTIKRVFDELESYGIEKLGADTANKLNSQEPSELRVRVLRRAHEIKLEWEANPIQENEDTKPKGGRWGRKKESVEVLKVDSEIALNTAEKIIPPVDIVNKSVTKIAITPDVYKNIEAWNRNAKRMTNSFEKLLLNKLSTAAYQASKNRPIDDELRKQAERAIESAIFLGYDPSKNYT